MPWFNVDDGFANSKPVLRISRRYRCAAIGLWTLAGSWSAKELTDGFIPDHAIEEFASTPAMAGMLVRAGLWREVAGGWQFENWAKYQKTKEQVYAFRAAEAERKRVARSKPKPPGGGGVSHPDSDRTEPAVPLGLQAESGLPIPEPLPTPNLSSVETSSGGVTSVDAHDPRPECRRHDANGNPNDESCRACGKQRDWDTRHAAEIERNQLDEKRRARQARADAIKACGECDEEGWRYDDREIRCTHPETRHA